MGRRGQGQAHRLSLQARQHRRQMSGTQSHAHIKAPSADRQGGNNAGHTIVVGDVKYHFHILPSGTLLPMTRCVQRDL
jgi:hypothetical protein